MRKDYSPYDIARLIYSELMGELTEEEESILENWKNLTETNSEYYHKISNEENIRSKIKALNEIDKKKAWDKLNYELVGKDKIKKYNFRQIIKYAAAAVILLFIGTYFLLKESPDKENLQADKLLVENDVILSGTHKAILTTANNEKIELGKIEEKKTFQLNSVTVTDTMNTLYFTNMASKEITQHEKTILNTLETPRGGEYSIILSDGTKVFLNAETRLTFPEVFTKEKREVILDGEAYFDVTKNTDKPFVVKTTGYEVVVYGTSFNVSSYSTDKKSHTTLVEGNVGIKMYDKPEMKLKPGEQVYINKTDNSFQKRDVDVNVYTSWKNGEFVFDNDALGEIMLKLERWYDVETKYLNKEVTGYRFSGTLNRYDEIGKILKMISITSDINFNIQGNTIEVSLKE